MRGWNQSSFNHAIIMTNIITILMCGMMFSIQANSNDIDTGTGYESSTNNTNNNSNDKRIGIDTDAERNETDINSDTDTLLDLFASTATEVFTRHVIPSTDAECDWNWRQYQCEPKHCGCEFIFIFGDYHLGRSCRLRIDSESQQSDEYDGPEELSIQPSCLNQYQIDPKINNNRKRMNSLTWNYYDHQSDDNDDPSLSMSFYHCHKLIKHASQHIASLAKFVWNRQREGLKSKREEICYDANYLNVNPSRASSYNGSNEILARSIRKMLCRNNNDSYQLNRFATNAKADNNINSENSNDGFIFEHISSMMADDE